MDSSSNDSFAWSRVSDDSKDSDLDPMGSPETPSHLNAVDDELPPSKKTKKRKLKFEPPDSESSFDSPKKKKIKVENTEEYASKKKKKKKEKHDKSETLEYSEENVLEDYDYLSMKAKQEQDDLETATVFKTKKEKKSYSETDENNSFNENNTSKKKKKHGALKTDSDNDKPVSSPKKQWNKKKHEITADDSDNFIIEEKFSAGETEVQKIPAISTSHNNDKPASSPKKQRNKKKHEITADDSDNFIIEQKFSAGETEVQKIPAISTSHNSDKPASSPKKQRNKKKHEITADESDNFIIEDKFSAEETEVQKIPANYTSYDNDKPASSPKKQRNIKKHEITADESDNFIIEDKYSAEETEVSHDNDKPVSSPKKQRNKKKHEITADDSDNFTIEQKFSAGETEVQKIPAISTSHNSDKPASSPKKQRNKKKHEITADESDNFIIEDKFSAEETEVQKIPANYTSYDNDKPASSPKKQRNIKKHEITADQSDNFIIEDKFSAEETELQEIPANSMSHDTGIVDRRVISDEVEGTEHIHTFENSKVMKEKKVKKKSNSSDDLSSANNKQLNVTPRILNRIRFEDETDSDTDKTKKLTNKQNNTNKESAQLKKFLKEKTYLKPVLEKMQKCQEVTDNDELWILKCPQELDVTDFNNRDLILESKSKVKLNGGTYIGSLAEDIGRITVMTAGNEGFIIKNVPVNGVVTLRKRLPKPHLVEDNVMINQTDFIPLPDTKCRHPLFGSNFKSSLKLPSPVAQRLNDGHISTSVMNDTRKKKKKVKVPNGDLDSEIDVKPKIEVNGVIKKAKKRKHDKDSEKSVKKAKRIKQEHDSSDVWESEKAIEENLFNY